MNPHIVAIFGGAVSGAEAAFQLARRGIRSVVFEQNLLPYGKIEDGLPKWHAKLRDKEEANINDKLSLPEVTFVPGVSLGKDIDFKDLVENWGFSAILLATGAWRDRPLPVEGIDDYIGKGLYYQNPFIHWYNHCHEPGFKAAPMEIADGALVIGGGLASIDIVKALMMETVQQKLGERGILVNMFDLERGIAKVLESHQLSLEDLGLKGCTLVYRRRIKDMPLSPAETGTPEQLAKAESVREKVLQTAQSRFLFNVLPCHVPVDKIVDNGRLAGLVLRETRVENGRVSEMAGTDMPFPAPLVISSIGSIPEPIPGIPMSGQTFEVDGDACCRLRGFQNVFALGNAVTGRGNIKESMEHGRLISDTLATHYLVAPEHRVDMDFREREQAISETISRLTARMDALRPAAAGQPEKIQERVRALHAKAGYDGDYRAWVASHLPVRLETLLGAGH